MATRLGFSPHIELRPTNFRQPEGTKPVLYPTFDALTAAYPTFDDLRASFASWNEIMQGHPGYDGGLPSLPGGTGIEWGVLDDGVEWIVTDGEGIDDSPSWDVSVVEPAAVDGTWLSQVRAPSREITIDSVLLSGDREALARAKAKAASACAVPPRTAWLLYDGKKLPVAVSQTRLKHVGGELVQMRTDVRGIDIGSAGAGVWWEGQVVTTAAPANTTVDMTVGGTVPTGPVITLTGPLQVGTTITINDVQVTLAEGLGDIPAPAVMVIDCRRRQVTVNGQPKRSAISLAAWPLATVGLNEIRFVPKGATPGTALVSVTELSA